MNSLENLNIWNYEDARGWTSAISWVKEKTMPTDVLMARQGNYWSWLTNRKAVHFNLYDYGSVNKSELIYWIKCFSVNFIVVDQAFIRDFPNLSELYSNSTSFYGSNVVFNSVDDVGSKIIIHNVTNIAYGTFTEQTTLITNWENISNWYGSSYYGKGTMSLDYSAEVDRNILKIEFAVNQYGEASVIFNPPETLNFTDAQYLNFHIKIESSEDSYVDRVAVKIATTSANYFAPFTEDVQTNTYVNVVLPVASGAVLGKPTLSSVDYLQFYVTNLKPEVTYTIWIDQIYTTNPIYKISSNNP